MIYIVEFPRQGRAHAWFAFDRDDFVRKVRVRYAEGLSRAEGMDEFDACVDALAENLEACRIYLDEGQAIGALSRDPLLDSGAGFYAHMALREQLIAMDAMEEDI